MSTRSDSSPQGGPQLQALTVEALKADKAALAAKRKASLAKANLKAVKKQLKNAKTNLKAAKKTARKASKKAKDAKRTLQACLDRTAQQRKKTRKAVTAPKKSSAVSKRAEPTPLTLPSDNTN